MSARKPLQENLPRNNTASIHKSKTMVSSFFAKWCKCSAGVTDGYNGKWKAVVLARGYTLANL